LEKIIRKPQGGIFLTHTVDAPLSRSRYLQPFPRYWALSTLKSRPWPSRSPWRHRSRNHWIGNVSFPIGGPLYPSLYL